MAWTQGDIDRLKAAIATGVREVQYADGTRSVYRSLGEMREVLALMRAEVAAAAGPQRSYRAVRVTPRSGY